MPGGASGDRVNAEIENEAWVRLAAFGAVLLTLLLWEVLVPLRRHGASRSQRWRTNFGLGLIDIVLVRLVFPAGAVGAAFVAAANDWGLLNVFRVPAAAGVIASVLVLDLLVYFQHWLFHAVPFLWRVHRVHHADPALDVSTALRFHPAESLVSMVLKAGTVVLLGLPVAGVLIFEIVLNAAAMFNHANTSLPRPAERWVRRLLVTPDVHRIHHSTRGHESSSNFGFSFSWWDRLFRTYRPSPACRQTTMAIGLPDGPPLHAHVELGYILRMPFIRGDARLTAGPDR